MEILKVSAQSDASATAGALANTIRESGEAELQGIGPKAINQAVKAIAIARSYLASSGVDLVSMPSFVDVEIDGEQRTALRFSITPRHRLHPPHQDGRPSEEERESSESTQRETLGGSEDEAETGSTEETEMQQEPDEAQEAEVSRPTSLSEAITGRPASELTEDADAPDERESSETSEDTGDDADRSASDRRETGRRSSFLGRARRSAFDTDRDVF